MTSPDASTARLLRFNREVLGQAQALAAAHELPGAPPYWRPVGVHLRHVIEHYEALLYPAETGVVDYDARPRDAMLEQDPSRAQGRLLALAQTLQRPLALSALIQVRGRGGLLGDFAFEATSTLERELVFVAGHAIHHFEVLLQHCQSHGIAISEHFGKAAATVAHEREVDVRLALAAATNVQINQEQPCQKLSVKA